MDLRRIQEILLRMRMVCNSTYLIDRKTHISPKLRELEGIVDELVIQNGRKMVIFSEWTTMTFLIARHLSEVGVSFVELSGKIPVKKRQALIDEFTNNPDCKVFLSTDAGGTGLNLQAADSVVNFELPWSPARLNQRIGRVNRIGQKSRCVNVVNLISKNSIEEKILAGIQLKTDLFEGVFEDGPDIVEFSQEKRSEMLNRLREMMGEEPLPLQREVRPSEEVPEDTPHYLNPRVLREAEGVVDVAAEETPVEALEGEPEVATGAMGSSDTTEADSGDSLATQPPEKIEAVLDSGMKFIGGLLEMATGRKIEASADDGRMVSIDRNTGEVTLKFKLPI
jgi:superfamily II DNA/RNA helicase